MDNVRKIAEVTETDIRAADAIAFEYGWSRAPSAARELVAAHREAAEKAERQVVVDWLRRLSINGTVPVFAETANLIERGDHRKG